MNVGVNRKDSCVYAVFATSGCGYAFTAGHSWLAYPVVMIMVLPSLLDETLRTRAVRVP